MRVCLSACVCVRAGLFHPVFFKFESALHRRPKFWLGDADFNLVSLDSKTVFFWGKFFLLVLFSIA